MTTRDIVQALGARSTAVVAVILAPLVAAAVLSLALSRDRASQPPWRHVLSTIVYFTCVPGMLAAVLTAYVLFFTGESLLDVSLVVHALPIVAMVATLILVSRVASFDALPGFDRLWGLMVLIAVTFVVVLAVSRTRIWLLFGGSFVQFLAASAFLFALLKWATHAAFRRRGEAPGIPPRLDL
jgi:hypothetical protein